MTSVASTPRALATALLLNALVTAVSGAPISSTTIAPATPATAGAPRLSAESSTASSRATSDAFTTSGKRASEIDWLPSRVMSCEITNVDT